MGKRKEPLEVGEVYHVYNRGVDKRPIFGNKEDIDRFLLMMQFFNSDLVVGGLDKGFLPCNLQLRSQASQLVNIHVYCLNENHFHIVLKQLREKGITKFMQRLGTGYTNYFNTKYNRTGSLFQGKFKSKHIDSDGYYEMIHAYVQYNFLVHGAKEKDGTLFKSSKDEYQTNRYGICDRKYMLSRFKSYEEMEDKMLARIRDTIEKRNNKYWNEKEKQNTMFE